MVHLRMVAGESHRGWSAGEWTCQQLPGRARCRRSPRASGRLLSSSAFGAGRTAQRKPAGHAADRNKCTPHGGEDGIEVGLGRLDADEPPDLIESRRQQVGRGQVAARHRLEFRHRHERSDVFGLLDIAWVRLLGQEQGGDLDRRQYCPDIRLIPNQVELAGNVGSRRVAGPANWAPLRAQTKERRFQRVRS